MKLMGPLISPFSALATAGLLMALDNRLTLRNVGKDRPDGFTQSPASWGAYAGTVFGGSASIAIVVNGGRAVAYLCDGERRGAWLQGPAPGGQLTLTSAAVAAATSPGGTSPTSNPAALIGTYAEGVAAGTITVNDEQWEFGVRAVAAPSGLYRATAIVHDTTIVGGWIVLPDGTQVGVIEADGRLTAAPSVDTRSGSATVDGMEVPARIVDGSGVL
jgi:hypothetical protein